VNKGGQLQTRLAQTDVDGRCLMYQHMAVEVKLV
jgi:hypothetical protein